MVRNNHCLLTQEMLMMRFYVAKLEYHGHKFTLSPKSEHNS